MDFLLILVATDDERIGESVRSFLGDSYNLLSARSIPEMLRLLHDKPIDIVIADETFDGKDVHLFLPDVVRLSEPAAVLVMVSDPKAEPARIALRQGAFDTVSRPIDGTELTDRILRAYKHVEQQREIQFLKDREREHARARRARTYDSREAHVQADLLQFADRSRIFTRLRTFIKAAVSIHDMKRLFDLITEAFADFLTVGKVALVLLEDEGDRLSIKASRGYDEEFVHDLRFDISRGVYPWFLRNDRVLIAEEVPTTATIEELSGINRELRLLQAELCMPVRAQGKLLGYLSLGSKFTGEPYARDELEFLFTLADYAATAIQSALLFERTKEHAIKDELTRLYSRRYWKESLEVEIERSKRYEHPLSIAIFDIDHFKMINDTEGHPTGDKVLRGISRFLLKSSRSTDVVGRYGGEEFIVILPETGEELALTYCERLREDVEKQLGTEGSEEFLYRGLNISGGMTTCDQKEDTLGTIIDRADRALLRAKNEGRNRIECEPVPSPDSPAATP